MNPPQENLLLAIKRTLEEANDVVLAIVYGSAASGTMRDNSDVDVAVLCRSTLGVDEKLALIQTLSERLGREVDLVDLRKIDGVLLKQILTKGKVVIKKDSSAFANLLKTMIYNEADYMPYYHRALRERLEKFAHGQGSRRE